MMEHAAIQGTFADLKSVKTRSVVQMVVEIPIEQAEQIVRAFGFPQPGAEIAVAVARLDPEKAKAALPPPETPAKPKKRFHELPLSQQAALRCRDTSFWRFLKIGKEHEHHEEGVAASAVRVACGVVSRSEILDGTSAGDKWAFLNMEYEQFAGLATEAR